MTATRCRGHGGSVVCKPLSEGVGHSTVQMWLNRIMSRVLVLYQNQPMNVLSLNIRHYLRWNAYFDDVTGAVGERGALNTPQLAIMVVNVVAWYSYHPGGKPKTVPALCLISDRCSRYVTRRTFDTTPLRQAASSPPSRGRLARYGRWQT